MAGTLTISTLSDGTNSTSATNPILGSVRAWVDFNGTTSPGTIRSSYNVSSVTRNATGDYTVNFTSDLANADYAAIGNATNIGNVPGTGNTNGTVSTFSATTAAYRFQTAYRTTNVDPGNENFADCRVAFFTS
jgi:hypothetical protein